MGVRDFEVLEVSEMEMKRSMTLAKRVVQYEVFPCHVNLVGDFGFGRCAGEVMERSMREGKVSMTGDERLPCLKVTVPVENFERLILPTSLMLMRNLMKLGVSHCRIKYLPLTIGATHVDPHV